MYYIFFAFVAKDIECMLSHRFYIYVASYQYHEQVLLAGASKSRANRNLWPLAEATCCTELSMIYLSQNINSEVIFNMFICYSIAKVINLKPVHLRSPN